MPYHHIPNKPPVLIPDTDRETFLKSISAIKQRAQEYNLNIQLENLFDDIGAGLFGEAAKTGSFYQYVSSVKAKYPK